MTTITPPPATAAPATPAEHPGTILRRLMARKTVMAPGAFNALVARAVQQAGFDACYISGGATANVAGYPDIGLITLTEMCRTIAEIAQASGLPTIADADTGHGAARTGRTDEAIDATAGLFPDLGAGRLDMGLPVGDVVELVRPDRALRARAGELLR